MCLTPSFIWLQRGPKFEQQPVPCKVCYQCKSARHNDFVGRSLAEASTSHATVTLTLTYAPRDDLADKILHPRHFQLFIKQLRFARHKIRYLVAGEYGETYDRTHFHVILFIEQFGATSKQMPFYNWGHLKDPTTSAPFSDLIPQKTRTHVREWPHGHVFADWSADIRAIGYVCKYLLPDDKTRSWISMSKKPALGAAYFAAKAAENKRLGVLPSNFVFYPPGGRPDRSYPITGATRRDYLNAITTDPADRAGMSEWCLKSFDKFAKARAIAAGHEWVKNNPEQALAAFLEQLTASHDVNAKVFLAQSSSDLWSEYWDSVGGSPAFIEFLRTSWGFTNVEEIKAYCAQCLSLGTYLDGSAILAPGTGV